MYSAKLMVYFAKLPYICGAFGKVKMDSRLPHSGMTGVGAFGEDGSLARLRRVGGLLREATLREWPLLS